MVKQIFDSPEANPLPAVCLPPGARLVLRDIPGELQRELGVGPAEEVTFTQLTAASHCYRDAVRFRNGHEILLQRLNEGQRVHVLALSPDGGIDAAETLVTELECSPVMPESKLLSIVLQPFRTRYPWERRNPPGTCPTVRANRSR